MQALIRDQWVRSKGDMSQVRAYVKYHLPIPIPDDDMNQKIHDAISAAPSLWNAVVKPKKKHRQLKATVRARLKSLRHRTSAAGTQHAHLEQRTQQLLRQLNAGRKQNVRYDGTDEFQGKLGHWITTKTNKKIFIENGKSINHAIYRLKQRLDKSRKEIQERGEDASWLTDKYEGESGAAEEKGQKEEKEKGKEQEQAEDPYTNPEVARKMLVGTKEGAMFESRIKNYDKSIWEAYLKDPLGITAHFHYDHNFTSLRKAMYKIKPKGGVYKKIDDIPEDKIHDMEDMATHAYHQMRMKLTTDYKDPKLFTEPAPTDIERKPEFTVKRGEDDDERTGYIDLLENTTREMELKYADAFRRTNYVYKGVQKDQLELALQAGQFTDAGIISAATTKDASSEPSHASVSATQTVTHKYGPLMLIIPKTMVPLKHTDQLGEELGGENRGYETNDKLHYAEAVIPKGTKIDFSQVILGVHSIDDLGYDTNFDEFVKQYGHMFKEVKRIEHV